MQLDIQRTRSARDVEKKHRACARRFLSFYARGFDDDDYVDLERSYKLNAHEQWNATLSRFEMEVLLQDERYLELAARATRIEGRTNLLFSFEKMALRDALKTRAGAKRFAEGLVDVLHGDGTLDERFERWVEVVAGLPRKQTRVLTWPIVTVFPFLADPKRHLYMKPLVTKTAAERWGFAFTYQSRPNIDSYKSLLAFGKDVKAGLARLNFPGKPRDQIDVQGAIWIFGSSEYD
jgi:hypothetical protein